MRRTLFFFICFQILLMTIVQVGSAEKIEASVKFSIPTGADFGVSHAGVITILDKSLSEIFIDLKGNIIFGSRANEDQIIFQSISPDGQVNWKTSIYAPRTQLLNNGYKQVLSSKIGISSDGNLYLSRIYGNAPNYTTILQALDTSTGELSWEKEYSGGCLPSVRLYEGINVTCNSTTYFLNSSGGEISTLPILMFGAPFTSFDVPPSISYISPGTMFSHNSSTGKTTISDDVGNIITYGDIPITQGQWMTFNDYSFLTRNTRDPLTFYYYTNDGLPSWVKVYDQFQNMVNIHGDLYRQSHNSNTLYKVNLSNGEDQFSFVAKTKLLSPYYNLPAYTATNIKINDKLFVPSEDSIYMLNPKDLQLEATISISAAKRSNKFNGMFIKGAAFDLNRGVFYQFVQTNEDFDAPQFNLVAFSIPEYDILGHWAEDKIRELVTLGIMSGYDDGRILPDIEISKEQFVAMLVRALKWQLEKPNSTYKDVTPDRWSNSVIETAFKKGIIDNNQTLFSPESPLTREEMAEMIAKALKLNSKETKIFSDTIGLKSNSWIMGVYSSKIISGFPDGTYRPFENTSRSQAAVVITNIIEYLNTSNAPK